MVFDQATFKILSSNPALAGLTIYFTAVLSYLARNVPLKLWQFLKHTSTTSLELNNAGYSGNEEHYARFLIWYMKSPYARLSRTLYTGRVHIDGEYVTVVGPGVGTHFFMLNKRLFWFTKSKVASTGTEKQKEEITIATFGRSHEPLKTLILEFAAKRDDSRTDVYLHRMGEWKSVAWTPKRSLSTVFINQQVKNELTANIDRFVNDRQWFTRKGMAYKLTFLLKGIPGSGKTSLIKALASHYERNLCIIDLSTESNFSFQQAIATLPEKSVLILEDVDAATSAVDSRDQSVSSTPMNLAQESLTLAGLLNALDGIIPLNDVLVFMTTNKPEKLDAALTRKSRVDYTYDLGPMENSEIQEFASCMYDSDAAQSVVFHPLPGCDVQHAFTEASESVEDFIQLIPHSKTPVLAVTRN